MFLATLRAKCPQICSILTILGPGPWPRIARWRLFCVQESAAIKKQAGASISLTRANQTQEKCGEKQKSRPAQRNIARHTAASAHPNARLMVLCAAFMPFFRNHRIGINKVISFAKTARSVQ
jgi:hypothetical protein